MASTLILPGGVVPSNLHLDPSVRASQVTADVYMICDRIAEVSPRLFIEELVRDGKKSYAIMEYCDDGVARLVFKTKELDARVVEKVQYLRHVPFEKRFQIAEDIEQKNAREQHENYMEKLYEQIGRPMWTQLEKDGFIDRPVSYPKVRKAA